MSGNEAILRGSTPSADPPATVRLMWCPECGRTDRFTTLGKTKHKHQGEWCDGRPVTLTYDLRPEPLP